jgi:type II secretion system protein N
MENSGLSRRRGARKIPHPMHGRDQGGTPSNRTTFRKAIKVVLIGVAVLAILLVLTFPTDGLVRSILAKIPVPAGRALTFEYARLRPWGLTVYGVAYRRLFGSALAEAQWIRLRPSWTSLLSAAHGNPWGVAVRVFDGDLDAHFDAGPGDNRIDVTWTDLDIERLVVALERDRDIVVDGRFTGRVALKVTRADPPSGDGEITVRSGSWKLPFPPLTGVRLHADDGTLQWSLFQRRLEVTNLALHGNEVDMSVQGFIRIAPEVMRSPLSLHVTIAAMDDAPPALLQWLDELPQREDGVADFRLTGTIDAPRVVSTGR